VPFIEIAYDRLSTDALYGVIKEFVTRDGTDYGEREVPLETKISEVLGQLKSGKAVIVFDLELGSCNISRSDDPALKS